MGADREDETSVVLSLSSSTDDCVPDSRHGQQCADVTSTSRTLLFQIGPFIPTDCSRLTGDYGGFVRMVDDEEPG